MKILQVLHLSVAELDPGSEQEGLAQLSTSQLCPITSGCSLPPASFPLAIVGTGALLPGELSTSQLGDAPPARLWLPERRLLLAPGSFRCF